MIRFERVYKSFPGRSSGWVLEDLSFRIGKGEMVFLLGRSGVGKTTILRLITLEERPDRGAVMVGGFDSRTITRKELPLLRRRCGMVFQDFRLLRDKTVFENVAFCLRMTGTLERKVVTKAVSRILRNVGIYGRRNAFPGELSGGEQQRVAIGRAMIHEPPILLADEPTGNLDRETGLEIVSLLARLNTAGTTVVVATHDEALAERFGTRLLRLSGGRIVEDRFLRPHGTEVY